MIHRLYDYLRSLVYLWALEYVVDYQHSKPPLTILGGGREWKVSVHDSRITFPSLYDEGKRIETLLSEAADDFHNEYMTRPTMPTDGTRKGKVARNSDPMPDCTCVDPSNLKPEDRP